MLFRLLVLVVRDFLITLSEIAYNINNNLNEVLLAIVFTVYNGNILNRNSLVLKVVVSVVKTTRRISISLVKYCFSVRNNPCCELCTGQFQNRPSPPDKPLYRIVRVHSTHTVNRQIQIYFLPLLSLSHSTPNLFSPFFQNLSYYKW